MNIDEKNLYEEFIGINLKYRDRIFDFINKNCPMASKKKNHILYEKIKNLKSDNQNEIIKRRKEILQDLNLRHYSKYMVFDKCRRCQMCQFETFKEVKKILIGMLDDIFYKNDDPEKLLNNFIINNCYFNFRIVEDLKGYFSLQKGDTLKDKIYFDFIESIPERINDYFNEPNEYFVQIAKLLLVNNKFLNDLNYIKSKYFYLRDGKYYSTEEYKKSFPEFQNELLKLRNNYNLTQRWELYILQGMLIYPIDDDGELIVPKDWPVPKPPAGEPGRMQSFIGGKKLPEEIILVEDESESTLRDFAKKNNNINIKGYRRIKDYKQPLRNFDRNFRWYRNYQNKLKNKNKKEIIFSDIFFEDILKYPQDWQESDYIKYYESKKASSQEKISDKELDNIEIRGINIVKRIIYELDNIVYKKEK